LASIHLDNRAGCRRQRLPVHLLRTDTWCGWCFHQAGKRLSWKYKIELSTELPTDSVDNLLARDVDEHRAFSQNFRFLINESLMRPLKRKRQASDPSCAKEQGVL